MKGNKIISCWAGGGQNAIKKKDDLYFNKIPPLKTPLEAKHRGLSLKAIKQTNWTHNVVGLWTLRTTKTWR